MFITFVGENITKIGAKPLKSHSEFGAKLLKSHSEFGANCIYCSSFKYYTIFEETAFMDTIYFRRKIDKRLSEWFESKDHSPALVYGIRQCGKSKSIEQFAKSHFKNVNSIDFWKTPNAKIAFEESLEVDAITKSLTGLFPSFKFVPHETVLILDEIQDCPKARLALKSFKKDGRYEIIASGSYIGLNIDSSSVPKPNGSEDFLEMKTMDFEEFLWAMGYDDAFINDLLKHFKNKTEVPKAIHLKMKQLFNEYVCVGGYPEALMKFINSNSYSEAFKKVKSLIIDIKGDPAKRKNEKEEFEYTATEIARIQKAFDLIAAFVVKDNQRFITSKISGNSYQRSDAVNYLLNSSVAYKAFNVEVPSLPLAVRKIDAEFKLFYADIGIMINELGFDVIKGILQNGLSLGMNKGYLYEAVVADSLYKANVPLFYFGKESGLEVDLVISYNGDATLIEAKSTTGNTKSSKQIMKNPDHYGKTKLIKIGDYNISETGDITTIPHYLTFVLGKEL